MKRMIALLVVLGAGMLSLPGLVAAEIYKYVDERGNSNYVDGLLSVPPRYRATAVPMRMRDEPPAPPAAPAGPGAAGQAAKPVALGSTVIEYPPGQRIMVEVKINGTAPATLVLDTGADHTLISPRALQAAGVSLTELVGSSQMTGVTGGDRVNYVIVNSLEVGQAKVSRLPVAAYEIAGEGVGDGLLGRDFLDQFRVSIDSAAGIVTMDPKSP